MSDRPEDIVRRYFERIRARDPEVAELFHENAKLVGLGTVTEGKPAIREFYERSIRGASPTPTLVGSLLVAGPRVGAEIRIALANGTSLHVLDLFVVEAGRIESLTYFVAEH